MAVYEDTHGFYLCGAEVAATESLADTSQYSSVLCVVTMCTAQNEEGEKERKNLQYKSRYNIVSQREWVVMT